MYPSIDISRNGNMSNTTTSTVRPGNTGIVSIIRIAPALLVVFCLATADAQITSPRLENDYMLTEVPSESVRLSDTFWTQRLNTNRDVTADHCLVQLRKAGQLGLFESVVKKANDPNYKPPEYTSHPCGDSDTYKVLQGICHIIKNNGGVKGKKDLTALNQKLETVVASIAAAQKAANMDGYLFPHMIVYGMEKNPKYVPYSQTHNTVQISKTPRSTDTALLNRTVSDTSSTSQSIIIKQRARKRL